MKGSASRAMPVLMYHGLHVDPHSRGRYDPVYSVHPDQFARQLDWLLDNGLHTVRTDEACNTPHPPKQPVLITFDDGDVSNIEVALPMLLERGMVAEFFITSDFIDQPSMLSSRDVRTLAESGMGIGAHGRTHRFLEDLEQSELEAELEESHLRLSAIAGYRIDSLALPGGRGGERERMAALQRGYHHLFGSMPGPNHAPAGQQWWQRIAITRNTSLDRFGNLVLWHGLHPRWLQARFAALAWPKRLLGNARYERARARWLSQP